MAPIGRWPLARSSAAHKLIALGLMTALGLLATALAEGQTAQPSPVAPPSATPAAATGAPSASPASPLPAGSPDRPASPDHKAAVGSAAHPTSGRLDWKDLTAAEQNALAPLAWDWEKLEFLRRKKWVEIARHFPEWTPEEQKRRQDRMRDLVRLTPEERRVARDTFARVQALPPEKRAELFRQYEELPDDKKAQLAAEAKATKSAVAVKPLALRRPVVPSKAQIREGSEQKVPGPPRPVKPAPAPPAEQTAGSTSTPNLPPSAAASTPAVTAAPAANVAPAQNPAP